MDGKNYLVGTTFVLILIASIASASAFSLPPSISLTSTPLNHSLPSGYTIRVSALATDQYGGSGVSNMAMFQNGTTIPASIVNNCGGMMVCSTFADLTYHRAVTYVITANATDMNSNACFPGMSCHPAGMTVTWENRKPTAIMDIPLAGYYTGFEGSPISFDGSASHDDYAEQNYVSDPSSLVAWEWDCTYDGNAFNIDDTGQQGSCTYPDNGTFTVALRVRDEDHNMFGRGEDITTAQVQVANVNPTATATNNGPVPEGSPATITINANDASSYDRAFGLTYYYDCQNDGNYETVHTPGSNVLQDTSQCTWNDNNTVTGYLVKVKVADKDGGYVERTTSVMVTDLGPTAVAGSGQTINEGQTITVDPSASTSSPDAIVLYEWDWTTDGTYEASTTTPTTSTSPVYAQNGTFTVTLRVTDDDGTMDTDTLTVTVNDVSPTASLTGDTNVNEGAVANFDASASTAGDPTDAITSYDWDWTTDGTYDLLGATATESFTYMDNGTYTVTVRVNDEDSSSTATHQISVADLGPTAAITFTPTSPTEIQVVTFDATGSTSYPDAIVLYEFDWTTDGNYDYTETTTNAPDSNFDGITTYTFPDNGTYTVTVRVRDDDGTPSTANTQITLTNAPPSDPTTLTPATGIYGGPNNIVTVTCSGSTDASADTIVYDIDAFYSGSWNNIFTGVTGAQSWNVAGIATQPGVDLRCRAQDNDGAYSNWFNPAGTLTIDNTLPVVTYVAPTPANSGREFSNQVTINVTVTDQVTLVDTCTLDWNDGTTQANYTMTKTGPFGAVYYCTRTMPTTDGLTYTHTVYANDSANNLGATSQWSFTENTQPSTSTPTLTPASPTTTTDVNCSVTYTDAESDAGSVYFTWYNNNQVVTTNTVTGVSSGSTAVDTLGFANFVKNDVLVCEVWSADPYETNMNKQNSTGLTIVNTAPIITTTPATITKNTDGTPMIYDFNATDIDVDELVDTLTWSDNSTLFTINSSTGLIVDTPVESEQGTHTILITVTDGTAQANHVFNYVIVDVTPPVTTDNYTNNTVWRNTAQVVSLTCTDGGVGCSTTMYCVDQAGTCTPNTVYTGPVTISNSGVNSIRYHSNDTNNNWEAVNTQTVRIDYNSPGLWLISPANSGYSKSVPTNFTIYTTDDYDTSMTCDAYINGSLNQTFSCANATQTMFSEALSDGNYTWHVVATDHANNTNTSATWSVFVDTVAPTSFTVGYTSGWNTTSPMMILLGATDPAPSSGLPPFSFFPVTSSPIWYCQTQNCIPNNGYMGLPLIYSTDGIFYLGHRAVDNAGNWEAIQYKTIMIDTVAPAFSSHSISPNPPNEDQDVTISVNITDATSGVASAAVVIQSTSHPAANVGGDIWQVTIGQGNYSARQTVNYYWTATDTAGNTNNSANQAFTVSNQAPYLNPPPSLNDTAPYTHDTLFCNAGTFQDNDAGDTQQATSFMWFLNGGQIAGQTTQTLDLSQAGNGDRGDIIICSQQVSDGFTNSAWYNSSPATVQNSVPTVPTSLTPATGLYGGTSNIVSVSCSGSTDADPADTVSYDIDAFYDSNWSNIDPSGTGSYSWDVSAVATQTGVDLQCRATDGTSGSAYYNPAGTLTIDNTAPTTTDDYTQSSVWQNTAQTITLTCTDTGAAGCGTTLYCIDMGAPCAPNTVYTGPVTIANNGTSFLRYASNDTLGNQETTNVRVVRVDMINPIVADNYASSGVWVNTPQTVTLTPVDGGGSGIATVMYCTGAAPCSPATGTVIIAPYQILYSAQQNTFTNYQAWDVATNPSNIGQYQVMIDLTAPTITDDYAFDGVMISTSPQTVTLSPADTGGSGVNQVLYCHGSGCTPATVLASPYQIVHSGDQNNVTRYQVTDVAGNPSAIGQYTVVIDTTAPSITLNSPANNSYTNNVNATLDWTAIDNAASTMSCDVYLDGSPLQTGVTCQNGTSTNVQANSLSESQHTWYVTATDGMNLTGTSFTNIFTVDLTPPAYQGNNIWGGWFDTSWFMWLQIPNYDTLGFDVTATEVVSWTNVNIEDSTGTVVQNFPNVPAIQTYPATNWNITTAGLADGQYFINATITDLAGNPSNIAVDFFYVDNTAPSYTAYTINPANVTENTVGGITVTVDATDSGSGVNTGMAGNIWYRYNSSMAYASVPLTYQSGSTWSGTIPATDWNAQRGNTLDAYAEIFDNVGNMIPSAVQSELIDNVNDAPVMNVGGLNGMTLAEDTSTTVDMTTYATDEEDAQNQLVWSCSSNVPNVPVSVTNRILSINATNDFNGMVTISCTVTDTVNATDSGSFQLNVTPVNDAPVLTAIGTQLAFVLEQYSYQVQVTDVDGDTLSYSDNTALFNIDSTGLISFTPVLSDIGSYMVNITASDGQYTVYENVNYTVYIRHDGVVNSISYNKAGTDVYINDNVLVTAGVYNNGYETDTYTVNLRDGTNVVSSQQVTLAPGQSQTVNFTWNPAISGYRTVSVQVATVAGEGDATNNVQYLNNIRVWSANEVIFTSKFKPEFNPSPVNQSSLFTLRYQLHNRNTNVSFTNFPVTITLPTGFVLVGSTQQYHNLTPGQNTYYYYNVTSPAAAGTYQITVTAGYNEYNSSDVIQVV